MTERFAGIVRLEGSTEPIVIAPTPMPLRDDQSIDHEALERNVQRWNGTSLSGFLVGSAGGEEAYFDRREVIAAVRTVAGARAESKIVIGGIDAPSAVDAICLAEYYARAGADLVRVRIPQGPQGSGRGNVVQYFEEVAANSPLPIVVIHQTWQTGGVAAAPEEIGAICSFDNVFAYIHWHNIRYESYVMRFVPEHVRVWSPNASLLLSSALIGASGACAFFANWGPGLVRRILQFAQSGDVDNARPLQRSILAADYLGMKYGVPALKAGLDLLGYEGTAPRRPVLPLDSSGRGALRAALFEAGLMTATGDDLART